MGRMMNPAGSSTPSEIDRDDAGRLALETEVRELRQRLSVRERSLAELNRRVVQLERGGAGITEITSLIARNQELESQLRDVSAEIKRLHQTKLLRWSRPARAAYAWAIRRSRP